MSSLVKSNLRVFVLFLLVPLITNYVYGQLEAGSIVALDDDFQVQASRVAYDRRTGQFSSTVTATNISSESVIAPLYLVIDNTVPSSVTVANADGATTDGSPYFVLIQDGELAPGEALSVRLAFNNPQRLRFNFLARVYGERLVEITLDQGLSSMTIQQGYTQYVAFAVNLSGVAGHLYNVILEQSISPSNGGITLNSDYPGGWSTSTDMTWPVNEFIIGHLTGTYIVTTTATVIETGDVAIAELIVNVVESIEGIPVLWQPGAEPDGITPGNPTDVTFSVLLTGVSSPSSIQLEQVDEDGNPIAIIANLVDGGQNGDVLSDDGIYSGSVNIVSPDQGKFYYRTTVDYGGYNVVSDICVLTVTDLPVGPTPSDPAYLIVDPIADTALYSNEVLVSFIEGTSQERIEEIVASESAVIIGTIPSLGIYQVEITGDGTVAGVYLAIDSFEGYPEVEYAEGNYQEEVTEFTPNDPSFSSQTNMTVIRADEAWVVAKGTVLIGVVDTGVDYDHEDLTGKVIKGKDYVDNDDDPDDPHSHGTHVAGIAAASSNNGKGVAGVSWGSKILAVRTIGGAGYVAFAAGVRYAADNGAKVINYSGSGIDSNTKHDAVKYAVNKGCLFVCAAGNLKGNTKVYPAGYDEVFCVGNSTDSDGRASSSNYGTWVDIAAPGVSVTSTIPDSKYGSKTGTSMSSPLVAGAAAVVWSMNPSWNAAQVRERLEKTSEPLASTLQIGVGRLDLFEAVFNGSFEIGDLSEWTATGTCSSLEKLGPLVPTHRKRMGYLSTGPSGDFVAATLEKTFTIQPGVTSIPIKFEYDFVTEEYPEWVGTIFDDALLIWVTSVHAPDLVLNTILVEESVNGSTFFSIGGIDFPGGDNTVGHTQWKTASATIPVTQGSGTYTIHITDAGDDIYDSVVLIDNIRLK